MYIVVELIGTSGEFVFSSELLSEAENYIKDRWKLQAKSMKISDPEYKKKYYEFLSDFVIKEE